MRIEGQSSDGGTREALLGHLFDHAPLFPPASLAMLDAVAEDRRVRASAEAWMVGRFVCPATALAELLGAAAGGGLPALSVVLDGDLESALAAARGAAESGATVEAVERRPAGGEAPRDVRRRVEEVLGPDVVVYVELAAASGLEELARVGDAGAQAKLRCGGPTAEAFPGVDEVAGFIAGAREAGCAFKATAGLHHPVRRVEAGTGLPLHGFLNLLAAACAAWTREAHPGELAALVAEEDAGRVLEALEHLDTDQAAAARRELFHGIGTCSVAEPVDDLRALGVLPG